eukprot:COSAG03_NODE_2430_length_2780_cov_35.434526_2_plen_62_part_00
MIEIRGLPNLNHETPPVLRSWRSAQLPQLGTALQWVAEYCWLGYRLEAFERIQAASRRTHH